jgi:hypothetical protein
VRQNADVSSHRHPSVPSEPQILSVGDYIHVTLAEIHPEVSRFTYPLFAIDDRDRPDLYASCVLLEHGGLPFIVTAAHAISEIGKTGSSVHIGARHITALAPEFVLSSPDGQDSLDIAAMIAPRELLEREEMEVLPQGRTTVSREFGNYHLRCVHGYPCNKNKQEQRLDIVNKRFTRYGFTYAGASKDIRVDYSKFKKDPQWHIALEYQRRGRDETRQIVTPPHPKGISGGGSWLVPDSTKATTVYLEGIAIEYHKSRSLVFSTRIEHVITFIRQHVSQPWRRKGDC